MQLLFSLIWLCLQFSNILAFPAEQRPLTATLTTSGKLEDFGAPASGRRLHGRFLHITDLHPDPFYKYHSSTEQDAACHRGHGSAGALGAEITDCDSPISLINATFKWIDYNLKDSIDFVVWTGDSARHDNDEDIPRTDGQIMELNELLVSKFVEVFGKEDNINDTDPTNDFIIPIIPTFGNNDIRPHNIFLPGPNRWTKSYLEIWRKFIPEAQRHGFGRGGWFFVEVIPNELAVFSLNTLYFFDSNTAVDGCAKKSEPGYEQMEWLRIQLQFLRERGVKAIMTGHVPPARTESKLSWDETCWQKYTLWMKQYRDVVVGSLYGHMNIDHFMLQDSKDIKLKVLSEEVKAISRMTFDEEFTLQSSAEYLSELRSGWAEIPDPPKAKKQTKPNLEDFGGAINNTKNKNGKEKNSRKHKKKHKKSKEEKYLDKIGGQWGERYSLALVGPSVVPNYFPTLRVIEYNITDLIPRGSLKSTGSDGLDEKVPLMSPRSDEEQQPNDKISNTKKKHHKKLRKPKFITPFPPSKSAPPGPAYSPQSLTWLGYIQYYANLTKINGDFGSYDDLIKYSGRHEGEHVGETALSNSGRPNRKFKFEVEYDTRNDTVYNLKDLTVRSYIDLASRIGQYKPGKKDQFDQPVFSNVPDLEDGDDRKETKTPAKDESTHLEASKKKHRKHEKHKAINMVWFTFVKRAFVGSRDDKDLHNEFGQPIAK